MASVFISYRRANSAALAHYFKRILDDHGISAYLDVKSEPKVGLLDEQIKSEIENCTVFVCFLEATTLESEWVRREIELAYQLNKKLIPVRQENFSDPTFPLSEAVTNFLAHRGPTRIPDRSSN